MLSLLRNNEFSTSSLIGRGFKPFVTQWEVSAGQQIIIPIGYGSDSVSGLAGFGDFSETRYHCDLDDISVDGLGNFEYVLAGEYSREMRYVRCTYNTAGIYKIGIVSSGNSADSADFAMNLNDSSLTAANRGALRSVVQWGDILFYSMDYIFRGAESLRSVPNSSLFFILGILFL